MSTVIRLAPRHVKTQERVCRVLRVRAAVTCACKCRQDTLRREAKIY